MVNFYQANSPAPKVGNTPVLIVDALGRTADPQATEVAVVTSVAKSSAKVVCHSPSDKYAKKDDSIHATAVPHMRIKIADRYFRNTTTIVMIFLMK